MTLHLFEGFGVELEYMIVDAESLDVRPVCDEVLKAVAGKITDNVDFPGNITWSNELALHVLELKSTRPLPTLDGAAALFQEHVGKVNDVLKPLGARLLPGAMHPWMDPYREMVIWPHEYSAVYEAFNRIFDCRGHGWANLQSVHLNLPFIGDEEFGRLHAAVRVLLPILPALAASSPIMDGRATGILDNRLEVYRHNSVRIPSVNGGVIPEAVFTRKDYEDQIFTRMYADVAPYDPEGVLRDEFLNSRGAIARFGRGSIEIRVLDVQECPAADIAICAAVVAVLRGLVSETLSPWEAQKAYPTDSLRALLLGCIRTSEGTPVGDPQYLELLGLPNTEMTAGEVWRRLVDRLGGVPDECKPALDVLLREGTLASRLIRAAGENAGRSQLLAVYAELAECLRMGQPFGASAGCGKPRQSVEADA